jgi:hypothetical protein
VAALLNNVFFGEIGRGGPEKNEKTRSFCGSTRLRSNYRHGTKLFLHKTRLSGIKISQTQINFVHILAIKAFFDHFLPIQKTRGKPMFFQKSHFSRQIPIANFQKNRFLRFLQFENGHFSLFFGFSAKSKTRFAFRHF